MKMLEADDVEALAVGAWVDAGKAIARARELAERRALEVGAEAKRLSVVEAEDLPIAYLPGNAVRVRVKVVGDIKAA